MSRAILLAVLVLLAGCSPRGESSAPGPSRDMTAKEVMKLHIEPSAQIFWHSSGYDETAAGSVSLAPTTDQGWARAEASIATVEQYAKILRRTGRWKDKKDWQRFSRQLDAKAAEGRDAVRARDDARMFEIGGDLYGICSACHQTYLLPFLGPDGRPKKLDENGVPIPEAPVTK